MQIQIIRMSERDFFMPEYLQVSKNGQITLPDPIRRKAKIAEGDLLESIVDTDGTIRLVAKLALNRSLAEKYQHEDIDWAVRQKGQKA